jgi:hypothetical protein
MTGGRSTARSGWAAIVGVVIGAALLAGAHDPQPASATRAHAPSLVRAAACPDGAARCPLARDRAR